MEEEIKREELEKRLERYRKTIAELDGYVNKQRENIRRLEELNQKAFEVLVDLAYKVKAYETQKTYKRLGE